MTITLEQIQELRKGITPGEWQFSESQIESSTDDGFQDVIPTTGCLVCEDGYCELDISYDDPNVKAIALVPELLEMAERTHNLVEGWRAVINFSHRMRDVESLTEEQRRDVWVFQSFAEDILRRFDSQNKMEATP
jgi:hypothetical protein